MNKIASTKAKIARSPRQRKSSGRNVSLGDVARSAGVSTATVSRTLNNPEKVAEKSRLAVKAAIDSLGYIPDGAARALASRQSKIIGAVVPSLDNALFAAGIQSLQRRLKYHGYTLIVASHEYDLDEELEEVKILLRQGVDGLLLVGSRHDPKLIQMLENKAVSYVNCWAYDPHSKQPCIGFDNRKAARKITQHLLDLGHTDFAVIAGRTENNDRAADRLRGIAEVIRENNLSLPEDRIQQSYYSVKRGREAMRMLLKADKRPTAVLCGNDILALGAIAECQSAGIKVPQDISITGFDDLDMSSQMIPALTTIHVPSAEMGEQAADFLVAQIRQQSPVLHTEIMTDLMLRETTTKPRN